MHDVYDTERGLPFGDSDAIGAVPSLGQNLATSDFIDRLQNNTTGKEHLCAIAVGKSFPEEGIHIRSSQWPALVLDICVTAGQEFINTASCPARMTLYSSRIGFLLAEPEGPLNIESMFCTLLRALIWQILATVEIGILLGVGDCDCRLEDLLFVLTYGLP